MKKFLSSTRPLEHEAALDNYPPDDKTILPNLVDLIRSDNDLSVLHKTVDRFNPLTKQSFMLFDALDNSPAWTRHRSYGRTRQQDLFSRQI
jgi:hypothetical protein